MPTLNFKGKTFVQNHHLAVKYHQLVPQKELSLTDKVSLHDNLIIQGDNLKALKALLPTYAGKVKCIYIDPPYNTGNEGWAYNDNVNSPMLQDWLKETLNGHKVDKEDLTRHDKWLCMMMPRLKLLRELLKEDGVIFISIDDNELHNLRVLLDEVFGETNFVACLVWEKGRKNDAKLFSIGHEYILVYMKNKRGDIVWREEKPGASEILSEFFRLKEIYENNYAKIQNEIRAFYQQLAKKDKNHPSLKHRRYNRVDKNGLWRDDNISWPSPDGPKYNVLHPASGKPCKVPDTGWRFSTPEKFWLYYENGFIEFREDHIEPPFLKRYLNYVPTDFDPDTKRMSSGEDTEGNVQVMPSVFYKSAQPTVIQLRGIMEGDVFENPKDPEILKRLFSYVTSANDIILDSFAGSGTTAHAVLNLNNNGGNRKFILVEQEDYANTITAERVRRVINGVKTAKSEVLKEGLGGTFSYFTLGDAIEMESLLKGQNLPSYKEFARYLFYTATGEEFDEKAVKEKTNFVGESRTYEVYLFYKPEMDWLKSNALTLELCQSLPKAGSKRRLVFAPAKYVDDATLDEYKIDFSQLPFEIYRLQK